MGEISSENFFGMINAYADYELMLRARTDDANLRMRRLNAMKKALMTGDVKLIEPAVNKFIAQHRLLVDTGSDEYRELCALMTRSDRQACKR
jgi:hypothetical protein